MGSADDPNLAYNNALPLLMNEYLPNGMLGLAITGLMASFMAGVAANVSAFNTVITTDLMEPYIKPGESDQWYVRFGRIATIAGLVVAMGTALIASTYDNLMNYVQALFSIFNSPLFAVFIIGMFWKRMTPWAGFWGLVTGTVVAGVHVDRLQGRLVLVRLGPRRVDVGRRPRLRRRRGRPPWPSRCSPRRSPSRSSRGSCTGWRTWTSTTPAACTSGGSLRSCSASPRSAGPPS